MSLWPGKYLIGLTGNIATGKSLILKMLEHLGAFCIDADDLAHHVIAKGQPGYQKVIDAFGKEMVNGSGEIDRARLGRLVFSDPQALRQLEGLIHPLVRQSVDLMVRNAAQTVVVIEAIKLLEGPLAKACDTIWVVSAPASIQKARLIQQRRMSEPDALQRISSQSPQAEKMAVADVVIHNIGSLEDTWRQVLTAWNALPVVKNKPLAEIPKDLIT